MEQERPHQKKPLPDGIVIRETALTDAVLDTLIAFSRDWEAENSCRGYRANTAEDLKGRRVFLALDTENGDRPAGYLFGLTEKARNASSVMPEGTACFEVEELYVVPACRSRGIGSALFRAAADAVREEAAYITLSTASKNWRAILRFYLEELHMEFWNARLFMKL